MKLKIMSLVLATALFVSCGTTYTSTTSNAAYGLPANIRTNFTALYPDATNVTYTQFDAATAPIDWELNGWTALDANDYAVSFDMGGRKYTRYNIESVQKESWKEQTAYEVKLKNDMGNVKLLVDSNGNVLKEKTKQ